MAEKKLDEAQALLPKAMQGGAPTADVQKTIKAIGASKTHKILVAGQQAALDTASWAKVHQLAKQIPEDSPFYPDSQAAIKKANMGHASALVKDARSAIKDGERDTAKGLVAKALKLAPAVEGAESLRAELEKEPVKADDPEKQDDPDKVADAKKNTPEKADEKADAVVPPSERPHVATETLEKFFAVVFKKEDDKAKKLVVEVKHCMKAAQEWKLICIKAVPKMRDMDALRTALGGTGVGELAGPREQKSTKEWGTIPAWTVKVEGKGAKEAIEFTVLKLDDGLRVAWPVEVEAATVPIAQPSRSKSLNTRRGFRLYDSGKFSGAASHFQKASQDSSLDSDGQTKARRLAANIESFSRAYKDGMAAADSGRPGPAIKKLSNAKKLDRRLTRKYQGRINKKLGAMEAIRAQSAFQSGRMWQAAKAARSSIKYDKASPARSILKKVESKADGILAKAKKAIKGGRKGEARRLLRDVVLILGAGDPRRAKAKKLLGGL